MEPKRFLGIAWMLSLQAAVLLGVVSAPAGADAGILCVASAPTGGDGPLAGDAPDVIPVPVVRGCYTGTVSDADDEDSYVEAPKSRTILVEALEGCFHVDVTLVGTTSRDLCEGEQLELGFIGPAQPLRLEFSNGPGAYAFRLG